MKTKTLLNEMVVTQGCKCRYCDEEVDLIFNPYLLGEFFGVCKCEKCWKYDAKVMDWKLNILVNRG